MSAQRTLILIGGGGHGAVVAEAAIASGWRIAGFLDDDPESEASAQRIGIQRLGAIDDLARVSASLKDGCTVHAATGSAELRRRWLDAAAQLGLSMDFVAHPSAVISPSAAIGPAAFVGPCAIVHSRALIGKGAIINSGAIVEHDVTVGPWAHIAPGSVLAGGARVGEGALIGCGAVVLPHVTIGRSATLGAGAVATRDVPAEATAVGAPARVLAAQE